MSGDWFNLNREGAAFYQEARFLKAARRFQAALDQMSGNTADSHRACVLYNLAQAQRARGNPEKAKRLLTEAEDLGLAIGQSGTAELPAKKEVVPYGSSVADDRSPELVEPAPEPDPIQSVAGRSAFWRKMRRYVGRLPLSHDFVAAWFCLKDSRTPLIPRFVLICVLFYFVWPLDLIPDILGVLGCIDDAGVLLLGLWLVHSSVTEAHKLAADRWFDSRRETDGGDDGPDLPPAGGASTQK